MSKDNDTSVRFRTIVLNMPNGNFAQFVVALDDGHLEPTVEGQPPVSGVLSAQLSSFIRKQHYFRKLLRKNKATVLAKYSYTLDIKTGELHISADDVELESAIKIGKKLQHLFADVEFVAYSLQARAVRTNGHRRKAKTSR